MKNQQKHQRKVARHKARRQAKKRHIRCTSTDVNPRCRIEPPRLSQNLVLWEIQVHRDQVARIISDIDRTENEEKKEKLKEEGRHITTHGEWLCGVLQRLTAEVQRRKNRRHWSQLNAIKTMAEAMKPKESELVPEGATT